MVCVALKGKPIMGIIHKPFTEITSWAWVGKGMSDDLKQKKVKNKYFPIILFQQFYFRVSIQDKVIK